MANILIVTANLPSWNKSSGGTERTATLAEALKDHNVTILSFSWDQHSETKYVADDIFFIKPKTEIIAIKKHKGFILRGAKNNHDVTKYLLRKNIQEYVSEIERLSKESDLLILDHFSASPLLMEANISIPIVYNSHNAELDMGNQIHPKDTTVLDIVRKMEEYSLGSASAMTYCSKDDIEKLSKLYDKMPRSQMYVPNGTILQEPVQVAERMKSKTIIFVGSGHPPNVVAAQKVIKLAHLMPNYQFVIVGSAGGSLNQKTLPPNVLVTGVVSDAELHEYFRDSFAFINPMDSGSGTHLKMMKALSYGIPIITSPVGARGFSSQERASAMILADSYEEIISAINSLDSKTKYKALSDGAYALGKNYDWEKIKSEYAEFINSLLSDVQLKPKKIANSNKEKVLIYSIVRDIERNYNQYYNQIKSVVQNFSDTHDFYLSIYENDSRDKTRFRLYNSDWSFFKGVSIVSEALEKPAFGSVKDPIRVENLSYARNKAIEGGGFINSVDYVLMVEGDVAFNVSSVRELLNFKNVQPDFDIVSAVSIRKNGSHYDWWATRTSAHFVKDRSELDPLYKSKHYGKYYSTSNGICLYRAKPFKEGIRHHWINKVTNEFDCEMVVLCQNFSDAGYDHIYINYKSLAYA
jgi:hypothetical protein